MFVSDNLLIDIMIFMKIVIFSHPLLDYRKRPKLQEMALQGLVEESQVFLL